MSHESFARSEGPVLADYELGAVVKRSAEGAVYETEFRCSDGAVHPAVIKVRELDADAAMTLVHRCRSAMHLDHPHLLHLYAAGGSSTNGTAKAWVVMERADESLAGVLAERALSEEEVGQMLGPATAALAYLHRNGYAHGALKPSNVLAAGDQLKLSCDNAIPVSEGGEPAEDIRALGALITESLTARGPYGVVRHPAGRFAEIVRHCSEPDAAKRWTAEQIAAHLDQRAAEPAVEDVVAEGPPKLIRARSESRKTPRWILAALGAVVLAVLLTAELRKNNNAPAPAAIAPAVSATPSAVPEPPPPAIQPAGRKADGWFVIVAAYGSREAAEKRMHRLAKRWPAFHLNVSEHSRERAPWLVTAGDNLSEDEAEALRARAVHAGLASDAYIKRIQ